ncbi:MAG: hypothetical protein MR923_10105 [Prevotella sp.]|nr:hypothetical protein [Prevotella sp.]MCI7579632.1 hypothetical protein [Prevotella sp.]
MAKSKSQGIAVLMPHYICNCLMKDAKGKADFSNKHDLCGYCKKNL